MMGFFCIGMLFFFYGDDFYFTKSACRECFHGNAASCRVFGEVFGIDFVEYGEILHIGKEASRFDDVFGC